MLQADALQASPAFTSEMRRISQPLATAGFQNFGALYNEVNAQVSRYITNGKDDDGSESATQSMMLGARARALLLQQQAAPADAADNAPAVHTDAQREFLSRIEPWAREAAQSLGVAPEVVAAHAALESGWGQRPLRAADGSDTHNLFGIKASANWQGGVAQALTTEFEQGQAVKKTENFRSYPNEASAFRDYARLLLSNTGYRDALGTGGNAQAFAQGLVRGGYATDPGYAGKLTSVARQLRAHWAE